MPARDIAELAVHLPRDSATMLAVHPLEEVELWSADTHLLAAVVDQLAGANWQRSGGKSSRPKPIRRPGASVKNSTTGQPVGGFRAWYASQRGGRQLNNN